MSNRAKQAALKAYPNDMGTLKEVKYILRTGFEKGHQQAEKEIIEKAVKCIEDNMPNYYGMSPIDPWEADFRKAMKE